METKIVIPVPLDQQAGLLPAVTAASNLTMEGKNSQSLARTSQSQGVFHGTNEVSRKQEEHSLAADKATNKVKLINTSAQLNSMIPLKMLPFNQFASLTVTPPFILKLCSMLSTAEFEHLIVWGHTGDTVLVKDLKDFASIVLPKYFKHKNFTSFLRQLNMYGFHTLRQGANWREFKNDLFRKGASHDYDKIKRKTPQSSNGTKGNDSRQGPGGLNQTSLNKDSRKRKKDELKRLSDKEMKSILKKQQELIVQLFRRCEANEERIESLQEEMSSLKTQVNHFSREGVTETISRESSRTHFDNISQEDTNMFNNHVGHEYGESLAFAQIEGRQRTLSDTCLSTFTLSNLGLQPQSNSFQDQTAFLSQESNYRMKTSPQALHWGRRKDSFDDMSLSFGDIKINKPRNRRTENRKGGARKKVLKNRPPSSNPLAFFVKDEKVKRKKKAMRNK